MDRSTGRHLVVAHFAVGVIYQVAFRAQGEADELAECLRAHQDVLDVRVDYVRDYRGRRITKVVL